MSLPLSELTRMLRGLRTRALSSPTLARLLSGVELQPASVAPYLSFRRGGYTRNLVYRDERFEMLILCWDKDARSLVHDHARQHCFFTPLYGNFHVDDYTREDGGEGPGEGAIRKDRTLVLGPGEVDHRAVADNEIHRVAASAAGPAISLHVYARPIERCLVFDERASSWKEKALRYDLTKPGRGEGPALVPFPTPSKE